MVRETNIFKTGSFANFDLTRTTKLSRVKKISLLKMRELIIFLIIFIAQVCSYRLCKTNDEGTVKM